MGLPSADRICRGRPSSGLVGDLVSDTRVPAEVLTIPQVAERLKVSKNTVYRLISTGELAVTKVASKSRVSEEALQQYVDRNTRVAS